MKRLAIAVVAGILVVSAMPVSAQQKIVPIQASNFRYCSTTQPGCLPTDENFVAHVAVGTRVQWKYNDMVCDALSGCPGHNVVFEGERGAPLVKGKDAIVRDRVFDKKGTYKYVCSPHAGSGMTGTLYVV